MALLHSTGLSHREFEPLVEELSDRYRLVLPDLPLHGDSEDRPNHPYTQEWIVEVLAGFIRDACGPRPIVGGHDLGALIALRAVLSRQLQPSHLILMPSALHRSAPTKRGVRIAARAGSIPGLGAVAARGATLAFRPAVGEKLSARGNPAARDLVRHAMQNLPRNGNRAKAWARAARRWPADTHADLLDGYRHIACPTLLLWADDDKRHPLATAEELRDLIPDAELRVLEGTGFLMAYDDAVGMAREIAAFTTKS